MDPLPELAPPTGQPLSPAWVARHDIALAARISAGLQAGDDDLGQGPDVVLGALWRVVGEDHRVVLVASQRLLVPSPGAQSHPAVARWRTVTRRGELVLGEADEPALDGVTDRRDHASDVVCGHVLAHELLDESGQALRHRDDPGDIGLLRDIADDVHHVDPLQAHEVRRRDDSERPPALEHRQVVDRALGHRHQQLQRGGVRGRDDGVGRHHRGHRPRRVEARGDDPAAQVTVGEDTGQSLPVHDQEGGHPFVGHHAGGLGDRDVVGDRDGLPVDQVARGGTQDRLARRVRRDRRGRRPQPVRPLGVEVVSEVGMRLRQLVEDLAGEVQSEGVLDGHDVEA